MKTTYEFKSDSMATPGMLFKPKRQANNGDIHVVRCLNGIDSVVFENGEWRESTLKEHNAAIVILKKRKAI